MRDGRSFLFDNRAGDAERALAAEADLAGKTRRPGDQADALVELARMQLDRGAMAEAGQSLRQARAALGGNQAGGGRREGERARLLARGGRRGGVVRGAPGERRPGGAPSDG